jgi:hypothetical protein
MQKAIWILLVIISLCLLCGCVSRMTLRHEYVDPRTGNALAKRFELVTLATASRSDAFLIDTYSGQCWVFTHDDGKNLRWRSIAAPQSPH